MRVNQYNSTIFINNSSSRWIIAGKFGYLSCYLKHLTIDLNLQIS